MGMTPMASGPHPAHYQRHRRRMPRAECCVLCDRPLPQGGGAAMHLRAHARQGFVTLAFAGQAPDPLTLGRSGVPHGIVATLTPAGHEIRRRLLAGEVRLNARARVVDFTGRDDRRRSLPCAFDGAADRRQPRLGDRRASSWAWRAEHERRAERRDRRQQLPGLRRDDASPSARWLAAEVA